MLEEIKITDKNVEIKPDENSLIVIPVGDKKEFVTAEQAEELERLIRAQLNLIKARKHGNRKTGISQD